MEPYIPFTANLTAVLFWLAASVVILDLILVRWLRLDKRAWKIADYVWLSFGVLGVVGAVTQVRMQVAAAQLEMYEKRATTAFDIVKSLVDSYASNPGPICRTFTRPEFSPPPDEFQRIQNDYNVACEWAKQVSKAIRTHATSPAQPLDRTVLPPRPQVSDSTLEDIFSGLDRQLGYYDQDVQVLERLRQKSQRSPAEETLVFTGPFLLALALALRITKVTGELKLESVSARTK